MKYKERVIQLATKYLGRKHTDDEAEKMLGGWNDKTKKEARNKTIDDTVEEMDYIIELVMDYRDGYIDCRDFHQEIIKLFGPKQRPTYLDDRWKNKLKPNRRTK